MKNGDSCIFKRLNLPVILVLQDRELADDEIEGKYNLSVVLQSDIWLLLFYSESLAIILEISVLNLWHNISFFSFKKLKKRNTLSWQHDKCLVLNGFRIPCSCCVTLHPECKIVMGSNGLFCRVVLHRV